MQICLISSYVYERLRGGGGPTLKKNISLICGFGHEFGNPISRYAGLPDQETKEYRIHQLRICNTVYYSQGGYKKDGDSPHS